MNVPVLQCRNRLNDKRKPYTEKNQLKMCLLGLCFSTEGTSVLLHTKAQMCIQSNTSGIFHSWTGEEQSVLRRSNDQVTGQVIKLLQRKGRLRYNLQRLTRVRN